MSNYIVFGENTNQNNDYVIFGDSTNDLTQEIIEKHGLFNIPLRFRMKEKDYVNYPDNRELDPKEFYDMVRAGELATTSLINSFDFTQNFEPVLQSGKDILYLCFSSGLSGSYQQSLLASEDLIEKYPDRKIICLNTLCASMGEGLITYLAALKKEEGKTITEVAEYVDSIIHSLCHYVVVDDLQHLKRGGRVSTATAVVGTLLGIKPILHVNDEGKLVNIDKVRGRAAGVQYIFNKMEELSVNPSEQTIFISHGDCEDDAKALAEKIKAKWNVKDIKINFIGPVVGTHSGPGTLALFFLGKHR